MQKTVVARSLAAAACGALALTGTAGVTATASDYEHSTVVSDDAVNWTPDLVPVDGSLKPVAYSIAEAGDQMVVGGRFGSVEENPSNEQEPRSNVFAFDATDGTLHQEFKPVVDGQVWSVVSDGTSVHIGGNFKNVDGTARPALAKLSLATGALDPNFNPPFGGGRVSDLELHDGKLFASGTFRSRLTALNPSTGKVAPYSMPTVTGKLPNSDAAQVFKFDLSPTPQGDRLVAVGNFTEVDTQPRPRVFMLDLGDTRADLSTWNYEPLGEPCTSTRINAIAYVQDVDFAPDGSYFALAAFGYMYQGYNEPYATSRRWYQICDSVARFETDTLNPTQPTWINYTGGDSLKSVAVTDAAIYVQGHSRWLDSPYGKDFKDEFGVDRLGGGAVSPDPVSDAELAQYSRVGDLNAVPGKSLP